MSRKNQTPPARMDDNYSGVIFSQQYKAGYINGRLEWYCNDFGFYSLAGSVKPRTKKGKQNDRTAI